MASGTIALTRTGSGYLTGQIVWSSTSNGSAANTSTVTATLQIQRSALNTTTGTFKGTFTVGSVSETISWYGSLPSMEWVTIKTITVTVNHNANGNGSCYLYTIVNGPTGTTMEGTYVSGSSTVTLDWIPRFASISSVTNFTDEGNPVINYSNPAGTAVSSLQACISLDGSTAKVGYKDIPTTGTSYTFPLTDAERNTLRAATPNSNTLSVYVLLKTVIGSSSDVQSTTAKMSIVNANPTISPTIVDTNSTTKALTGSSSILVALHSTAKVTINATALKYSTIASKKVVHGNASLTGDGTLSVTNNPIKITVTDSRGNSVTKTATNTIVPYIDPTCLIGNNIPETDGSFALEVTGLFYNGSIGATTNTLTVQYRYKAAGGSYGSWTTFGTVTKSGNGYTATANLTGLDYQTTYVFQARVIDSLHTSGVSSAEKSVIAKPVFDWGKDSFQFNVPVTFTDSSNSYAPGGYGLGVNSPWVSLSDLDNGLANGWYVLAAEGTTLAGVTFNYAHVRVSRIDSQHVQELMPFASNNVIKRICYNGEWGEWVCVYPAMRLGVEYRTTEHWKGKMVYAKAIDCGAFPATAGSLSVEHGLTVTAFVECKAEIYNTAGRKLTGPYFSPYGELLVSANENAILMYATQDGFSAYSAIVYLKYTKD